MKVPLHRTSRSFSLFSSSRIPKHHSVLFYKQKIENVSFQNREDDSWWGDPEYQHFYMWHSTKTVNTQILKIGGCKNERHVPWKDFFANQRPDSDRQWLGNMHDVGCLSCTLHVAWLGCTWQDFLQVDPDSQQAAASFSLQTVWSCRAHSSSIAPIKLSQFLRSIVLSADTFFQRN